MNRAINFIRGSIAEVQNITWPKRTVVVKFTAIIIAISALTAVYLGSLDLLFTRLASILIRTNG